MVKNWLFILSTLMFLPSLAQGAIFTASVDRQQLSLHEKLTLTLSLNNSDVRLRAEGVNPTIDLSVLHGDFDVGVPQVSSRYNIYQGRGRSTSELTIALYPKRAGQLTIPAFTVDDAETQALSIEVLSLAPGNAPEVFVRKGSNINTVWEGQQLVVFLDIYHRVSLEKAKMSDILETEPTRIELIPHWKLPQGKFQSEQFGFSYEVLRLAWAIFPDSPGKFSVYLPSLDITTRNGHLRRFPHQQLSFDIQPLPAGIPKDIIIGKPEISYTRLPTQLTQNQLASWSVTIRAPVTVGGLPNYLPLEMEEEKGLKIYPDRAIRETFKSSDGIVDQASYTLSLMPLLSGTLSAPSLDIPYFDTETGTTGRFEIPGQVLTVEASRLTNDTQINSSPAASLTENTQEAAHRWWQLSTLLFACLWLITLTYAAVTKIRKRGENKTENLRVSSRTAKPNNEATRLRQELLNALGTTTLAAGIEKWQKHYPAESHIKDVLEQLQRQYYGPDKEVDAKLLGKQIGKILELISKKEINEKQKRPNHWLGDTFKDQQTTPDTTSTH